MVSLNSNISFKADGYLDPFTEGTRKNIEIQTTNPDIEPPVIDLNRITINAEPTHSEAPNGETRVDISFRIKDNISGYAKTDMLLRNPHGVTHFFRHYDTDFWDVYFSRDATVYELYHKAIILPAGSAPGTWGLAEMTVWDKADNKLYADFTEIIRFEVQDPNAPIYTQSDINQDGTVNIQDLVLVANEIGHPGPPNAGANADINADGAVNILDLVQIANNFEEGAPAAPPVNAPTAEQIQSWLTQVRQVDDGSQVFRRGISVLEALLRAICPETTVLLPNYPNPFNPETWIPYQLANASDVQIIIYDTKGIVIRTLALGYQSAGYYTSRSRAVYWDGQNGLGESIASGVYFYKLQTDETSLMRKMVILK